MDENGGDLIDFLDGLLRQEENSTVGPVEKHVVMNPVRGRMIPLHEVSDPAFAEGILDVGVVVIPAKGCVYAPIDRTVTAAFPTRHATGLMNDDGMGVLIHVGTDTVTMKGDDFSLKVGQDDRVTRGQLLLTFEPEKIEAAGHETTTMVLISSAANLGTLEILCGGDVDARQKLYCLGQGRKSTNLETIRIYNDNVIMAHDENGQEMITIGKGPAFTKKPDEAADTGKIGKLFTLKDKVVMGHLGQLVKGMPSIYLEICEEVVRMLEEKLGTKLSESIYLTLTDHISLLLERGHDGIVCENLLLVGVKHFYKREFGLAKDAAAIIERKTGVTVSEDEVGFITLHTVNASIDQQFHVTMETTRMIPDILAIVGDYFRNIIDEESLSYQRSVRHSQFFIRRVLDPADQPKNDSLFYGVEKKQFSEAYTCVRKINRYVKGRTRKDVAKDEQGYLIYHIINVAMK